jgi:hypothetical protein
VRLTKMQVMGAAVALSFVVGGGGLASGYVEAHSQAHAVLAVEQHEQAAQQRAQRREQAAQQAAGAALERKLCATLAKLAANRPPAGNPKTNPSRAYDQNNHAILAELGPDIGCNAKGGSR